MSTRSEVGTATGVAAGHMKTDINPALKALEVLAGAWTMELSNGSFLPDPAATIRGKASFDWFEGGDFLIMRQGTKKGEVPWATWFIGRDDDSAHYTVCYIDDRRCLESIACLLKTENGRFGGMLLGFRNGSLGSSTRKEK